MIVLRRPRQLIACFLCLIGWWSCGGKGSPAAPTSPASPAPAADGYTVGRTYFGRNGYIEFQAGDLPIIISAPHGGSLEPAEIPNRTFGTMTTDTATEDLARQLTLALQSRTGQAVSLIVCRLKRTKLDANRNSAEGAQGNPAADQAWREYHEYLEAARELAVRRHGRGLVVDVHGHGHLIPRVELGYLLAAADLDRSDAELDDGPYSAASSIRTVVADSGLPFSVLLRGPKSLGGLLQRGGYPSVPSDGITTPGSDPYFSGGYITERHGSRGGSPVSAVQAELPMAGVRDSSAARSRFVAVFAEALIAYVVTNLGIVI